MKTIVLSLLLIFALSIGLRAQDSITIDITASIVKKNILGFYSGGWDPSTITVHQNDKVTLRFHSKDTQHIFVLDIYNINVDIEPGESPEVSFIADKPGTFVYHCGMECGIYHQKMTGQFIVTGGK